MVDHPFVSRAEFPGPAGRVPTATMRILVTTLAVGFGLTLVVPVLGVVVMLTGAIGLAILMEDGLDLREAVDHPFDTLEEPVAQVDHHGPAEKLQVAGDGGQLFLAGGGTA